MSALRAFAVAFCGGCVMLGALCVLVPGGKFTKPVKYAFCLCFLCLCLSAATRLTKIEIPEFKTGEQSFDNTGLSEAAAKLVFYRALTDAGIKFSKITVFTDKSAQGGISITKVCVYTAADYGKVSAVIGSKDYELVVVNE